MNPFRFIASSVGYGALTTEIRDSAEREKSAMSRPRFASVRTVNRENGNSKRRVKALLSPEHESDM